MHFSIANIHELTKAGHTGASRLESFQGLSVADWRPLGKSRVLSVSALKVPPSGPRVHLLLPRAETSCHLQHHPSHSLPTPGRLNPELHLQLKTGGGVEWRGVCAEQNSNASHSPCPLTRAPLSHCCSHRGRPHTGPRRGAERYLSGDFADHPWNGIERDPAEEFHGAQSWLTKTNKR